MAWSLALAHVGRQCQCPGDSLQSRTTSAVVHVGPLVGLLGYLTAVNVRTLAHNHYFVKSRLYSVWTIKFPDKHENFNMYYKE